MSNEISQDLVVFSYASPFHEKIRDNERIFTINDVIVRLEQRWTSGGKGGTDIGFGASVYDCSFILAHYLENHPESVVGKVVVELGCGPGLASLSSVLIGADYTLATDGDTLSTDLATYNFIKNLPEGKLKRIKAAKLLWGDKDDITSVSDDIQNFRHTRNSSEDIDERHADVILAADVAAIPYADNYWNLVESMATLLSIEGVAYLCYQRRHASEEQFFELLKQKFQVKRLPPTCIHNDFFGRAISIFECKLKISKSI